MHGASKTVQPSMVTKVVFYVITNVLTACIAGILLIFLPQFNPLLLFVPTIAFFAWDGGFMIGFFTTVISFLSITFMLFYPTKHPLIIANMDLVVEMAIFFFVGTFISYIIHITKQQDKITDYQRRLRQTHQIIETLERDYDKSQTEIQARDQFLAIASHELKTPVTSMLLLVQTAIHNIR